tara:strand:- start:1947 stop:2603 length:657 start_codon:yes stop_codon:yes gene_type:complete
VKFLILFTIFLVGYSTEYAISDGYAFKSIIESSEKIKNLSWKQWLQRQNYRKVLFGDSFDRLPMVKGQFYFFDPDLLWQIGAADQDLISNNGGSIFFWKTASKALVINDWTVIPDDREMPLGLVKVRWVSENGSYDKFLTILTENFACRPLKESNTCFKVDLMTDMPRKFVQRQFFDRLMTWDISSIENGRYRLVLSWKNGQLLSPVFNIQHSASTSR